MMNRRTFVTGSLSIAALGLAGCGSDSRAEPSPATVSSLTARSPFYIAHRGGGYDWPEMTAYAYAQAAALPGVQALEISVSLSKDGVLVCSHDATTGRMTSRDLTIADETWATLSTLEVKSEFTRDPAQPARPFTRFDEVASTYLDRLVLFVEPKTPNAVEPLMDLMVQLGQPKRTVWKQPINQPNFGRAKSHGFSTWGYVLDERGHQGDRLTRFAAAAEIDILGAGASQSNRLIIPVVEAAHENGKPTIMWVVQTVADRRRALQLGCQGLMTSDIAGLPNAP